MCILFIAIKQHPDFPLIICANRDEFHQRPTQTLHQWADKPIIAGKDLQAGGTWLGINENKNFAALTNYRLANQVSENKKSRGELVVKALENSTTALQKSLPEESMNYQAFNLLFGNHDVLHCFDSTTKKTSLLRSGFHSISNGAMDDKWPKMAMGEHALATYINNTAKHAAKPSADLLFTLMENKEQAPDNNLPNTGVPLEWEQKLSSIFIVSPEYGTRSTCILMQDNQGKINIRERSFDIQGHIISHASYTIE